MVAVAVLFLLVGALQYFDDLVWQEAIDDRMSFVAHFILIGLAIFWAFSAYGRIAPGRLRRSVVLVGAFIVLWLLLRFIRYKFCKTNDIAMRYLWYAYYIPQTAIPACLLAAACYVGNGEKKAPIGFLKWLSLPAALMIALIMTNDFHGCAFGFRPGFVNFETDYTHEPLYYLNITWQVLLSFLSVGIIFAKCRIRRSKSRLWVLVTGVALCVALIVLSFFNVIRSYKTPELFSLLYIVILEGSIQIGLIPSNSNYPRYFAASNLSAAIMDEAGRVIFRSGHACFPFCEEGAALQDGAVSADGNTVLHAQKIAGGRIVWTDDLTHINEINEQIKEVQENLNEETELIRAENELKEQRAKIAETRRIYNEVESAVYAQKTEIEKIISNTNLTDADYAQKMQRVGVLGAYVKRRGNLAVIAGKEKKVSLTEVGLSIKESLGYLALGGVHCAFSQEGHEDIATAPALTVYDAYEFALENIMETITDLTAHLGVSESSVTLRLTMEGKRAVAKAIPYAGMTVSEEEGTVFVRLQLPKGVTV